MYAYINRRIKESNDIINNELYLNPQNGYMIYPNEQIQPLYQDGPNLRLRNDRYTDRR